MFDYFSILFGFWSFDRLWSPSGSQKGARDECPERRSSDKAVARMCQLWDLLERECCGGRPRTPDRRVSGHQCTDAVCRLSHGDYFPTTPSWERLELREPVFTARGHAFPEPQPHTAPGVRAQHRAGGSVLHRGLDKVSR